MMDFEEYIDVNKDEIPYSMEIDLGGEVFEIEFNYNRAYDFFTVDLFKEGEVLVIGEKLILNRPLFRNRVNLDLPKVNIIPIDRAGVADRISFNNLNETVFLYVGELIE
ncbi:phage baseplate plug protein [Lysinibacillus sp. NPDC097162]|uniref:phage baseplate plug family protein n=1 Tax=Lysinibacillus sp. NPDC097162 TaxID=3364140 RepID=UPI003811C180